MKLNFKRTFFILSIISLIILGFIFVFFGKFAAGINDDLKTHYPKEIRLNDTVTLRILRPGVIDTIKLPSPR